MSSAASDVYKRQGWTRTLHQIRQLRPALWSCTKEWGPLDSSSPPTSSPSRNSDASEPKIRFVRIASIPKVTEGSWEAAPSGHFQAPCHSPPKPVYHGCQCITTRCARPPQCCPATSAAFAPLALCSGHTGLWLSFPNILGKWTSLLGVP